MNNKINQFEDIDIWKKAVEVAVEIYKESDKGKLAHDFGSKDQIRKSATSISNNIAEGFEYNNNKEFVRFLKYSKGSAGELRSQLHILYKSDYIKKEFYFEMHDKLILLSQQIANFIKYLRKFEREKLIKSITNFLFFFKI
ncbi:MAG: four helix bundle protein [Bacteroidota bacterium]